MGLRVLPEPSHRSDHCRSQRRKGTRDPEVKQKLNCIHFPETEVDFMTGRKETLAPDSASAMTYVDVGFSWAKGCVAWLIKAPEEYGFLQGCQDSILWKPRCCNSILKFHRTWKVDIPWIEEIILNDFTTDFLEAKSLPLIRGWEPKQLWTVKQNQVWPEKWASQLWAKKLGNPGSQNKSNPET